MKKTKKFLSLVLAVIIIVSTIPMAFAEGNTYKVGDIVSFGSYPQSKVTDEALVAELNALAPAWEDWTSYGYYIGYYGVSGSMTQGDWMRYVDITLDGKKYRGVKFTQYRPYYTVYESDALYSYQIDNGYKTNTVYWFKFESIDWRVLDPATGFVMCETIIDSQPYSNTFYSSGVSDAKYAYFNDTLYKNYANDYETSSIRKWLNEDFYNTAFTDSEKNEITITTLNNDGYYTLIGETGYEQFDSNETKDKIFLLSYNEANNTNFGFNSDSQAKDIARQAQGSDYAQSQGLNVYRDPSSTHYGNSAWFLRSAGTDSYISFTVGYYGESYSATYVLNTMDGIRPALKIDLTANIVKPVHKHNYNAVATSPTCKDQGYTTYTCACGDKYVADYVNTVDHKDDNKDYKCDFGCGYKYDKPASDEPEKELSFFEKIAKWFRDLFDKLFGWLKR